MHQYRRLLHIHTKPHDASREPDFREHQQVLGPFIESLDYACRVRFIDTARSVSDIC